MKKKAAARELINKGWEFVILQNYKKGKISTGTAAKELGISISELFDLMKDLGIRYDLSHEDCLEGLKNLRKIW